MKPTLSVCSHFRELPSRSRDRTGFIMLLDLFWVRFFLNFLFVPCVGLSWLHVSYLEHVKYTISYRLHVRVSEANARTWCNPNRLCVVIAGGQRVCVDLFASLSAWGDDGFDVSRLKWLARVYKPSTSGDNKNHCCKVGGHRCSVGRGARIRSVF